MEPNEVVIERFNAPGIGLWGIIEVLFIKYQVAKTPQLVVCTTFFSICIVQKNDKSK